MTKERLQYIYNLLRDRYPYAQYIRVELGAYLLHGDSPFKYRALVRESISSSPPDILSHETSTLEELEDLLSRNEILFRSFRKEPSNV